MGFDGARSLVAEQIGLPFEGELARAGTAYVLFKADLSRYVAHRPSILHWIFNSKAGFGEIGMGLLRAITPWSQWIAGWGFDMAQGEPDLSDDVVLQRIGMLVGDPDLEIELERKSLWYVNQQHATNCQVGRLTLALLATSHSPLLEHAELDADVSAELESAFAEARRFVHQFDPDVVVNFAPDHDNGLLYRLMPPFCIGYAAESIGDYGSQAGRLDVPEDVARGLAEAVIGDGIDLAVSLDMQVDHGAVRPIEILYGDIRAKPFVPVFINCVAPPFTPLQRVRLLGEAVGRHLATLDEKVLLIASGGLSHDPPVPRIATATPEQRRMLMGEVGPLSPEQRQARQQRVIQNARDFAAGTSTIQDLAPEWDRKLLEILALGDLTPLDAWAPEEMTRIAGHSSHEVRTWIAAYAALGTAGPYTVHYSYYRPSAKSSPASDSPPPLSTDHRSRVRGKTLELMGAFVR